MRWRGRRLTSGTGLSTLPGEPVSEQEDGESAMAMEFGMFHEFQCPKGRTEAEAFEESFAQVDAAERWGLDAMWLAELHTAPTRSVLSSALKIASAIAARPKAL